MKFSIDIKNRWSWAVQFTAEIEADKNASTGVKLGLAVKAAIKQGADLRSADLRSADLRSAVLRSAVLSGAVLSGADLDPAGVDAFQIPQEGELIVYKAVRNGIVKLRIPPEAKRTATPIGRKCRAEFAEVIEAPPGAVDMHTGRLAYVAGETVRPDSYDDDFRVECTHGIHFFLTRKEAEDYR